jgi:amidase
VALPVMASARGLPVGVQLVGRAGGDVTVLGLAQELESQLAWALKPAIFAG